MALKALAAMVSPFVLIIVVFGAWYAWKSGAGTRASDIHVADPSEAVRDARQLIEAFRSSASAEETHRSLKVEELPQSLRIPKLRYANVLTDHLNLVLGRNPDWEVGARIWSVDAKTPHADQATAYPEILFFQYCNDLAVSPQNLH